jgi:hypothetical protein
VGEVEGVGEGEDKLEFEGEAGGRGCRRWWCSGGGVVGVVVVVVVVVGATRGKWRAYCCHLLFLLWIYDMSSS